MAVASKTQSKKVDIEYAQTQIKTIFLIAAGFLCGVFAGFAAKGMAALDLSDRWMLAGVFLVLGACIALVTSFCKAEREHELRLVAQYGRETGLRRIK